MGFGLILAALSYPGVWLQPFLGFPQDDSGTGFGDCPPSRFPA